VRPSRATRQARVERDAPPVAASAASTSRAVGDRRELRANVAQRWTAALDRHAHLTANRPHAARCWAQAPCRTPGHASTLDANTAAALGASGGAPADQAPRCVVRCRARAVPVLVHHAHGDAPCRRTCCKLAHCVTSSMPTGSFVPPRSSARRGAQAPAALGRVFRALCWAWRLQTSRRSCRRPRDTPTGGVVALRATPS